MATASDCKTYLVGGKCKHPDAPTPGHSWCIGRDACDDYQRVSPDNPVDEALEALQELVLFQAESAKVRAVLQKLYDQGYEDGEEYAHESVYDWYEPRRL